MFTGKSIIDLSIFHHIQTLSLIADMLVSSLHQTLKTHTQIHIQYTHSNTHTIHKYTILSLKIHS